MSKMTCIFHHINIPQDTYFFVFPKYIFSVCGLEIHRLEIYRLEIYRFGIQACNIQARNIQTRIYRLKTWCDQGRQTPIQGVQEVETRDTLTMGKGGEHPGREEAGG